MIIKSFPTQTFVVCTSIFLLGASLFSCTEEDTTQYATTGIFGEINVDRNKIGTFQYFTVSTTYASGQNLESEEFVFLQSDNPMEYPIQSENGKLTVSTYFSKPGQQNLTLKSRNIGIFKDDTYLNEVTKTKIVDVVPSDIRCHFWYETREETLRNLSNYQSLMDVEGTDGYLCVFEKNIYGDVDYSKEASNLLFKSDSQTRTLSLGDRFVYYIFDNKKQLSAIFYSCNLAKYKPELFGYLFLYQTHIMKEDFDFIEYTYNKNNIELTSEETLAVETMIEDIKAGEPTTKENETIGRLISEKGLTLLCTFKSKNSKTVGEVQTFYSEQSKYSIQVKLYPSEM